MAQGQYDPLGLLCAFTIRFKIIKRNLSDEEEGAHVGWDDPVPASVESDFREVLQHLKDLKRVDFPRSIWPEPSRGPVKGISGSQLRPGLPEMGVGGRVSGVPAPSRKNKGRTQVKYLHSEDGTDGIPGGCQIVPKDQGLTPPGSERGKILQGFLWSWV